MKILFFSYAYPNPWNPGLATFNRTMIAGLAKSHDVRVVSPIPFTDVWKARIQRRLPQGLNASSFQAVPNVPAEYLTWYYTPKILRSQYGKFMLRSVCTSLNRTMIEFQPDIVLSYWTHPDGEVAVKTAHRFGVRAVTMVGGSDVLLNGRHGSRRNAVLDVLHAADGVVTVSEDIQQVLIADGIPIEKLHIARRGIDRKVFHPGDRNVARTQLGLPDDRPIVISVGRLVDVKGHTHLIEACQILAKRGISFRTYLLGDGPLRQSLQKQIDQAGLTGVVELRGPQSPANLAEWYRAADLSVLASLSEGVPNVLLESIASGTPFVASNVGGIPEIADPAFDTLTPASNPLALADAIESRLSTTSASPHTTRCFEPPTVIQSTEQLSSILTSVQKGQCIRSSSEPLMHETLTERDVVTSQTSPNSTTVAAYLDKDDNDDICGRTGEEFRFVP